jgi:hypothetical protein
MIFELAYRILRHIWTEDWRRMLNADIINSYFPRNRTLRYED